VLENEDRPGSSAVLEAAVADLVRRSQQNLTETAELFRLETARRVATVMGVRVEDVLPVTGFWGHIEWGIRIAVPLVEERLVLGKEPRPEWMRPFDIGRYHDEVTEARQAGRDVPNFGVVVIHEPLEPRPHRRWRVIAGQVRFTPHSGVRLYDQRFHPMSEWNWPEIDREAFGMALTNHKPHIRDGKRIYDTSMTSAELLSEIVLRTDAIMAYVREIKEAADDHRRR
jgi:hypothetical protein